MKDLRQEWNKMKRDAKNPAQMKSAVFEFIDRYSRDPASIRVLPDVLRDARTLDLSRDERSRLVRMTDKKLELIWELPVSDKRPETSISLNPLEKKELDIKTPLVMSKEVSHLIDARDAIYHVKKVKNDEKQRRSSD